MAKFVTIEDLTFDLEKVDAFISLGSLDALDSDNSLILKVYINGHEFKAMATEDEPKKAEAIDRVIQYLKTSATSASQLMKLNN